MPCLCWEAENQENGNALNLPEALSGANTHGEAYFLYNPERADQALMPLWRLVGIPPK